MLAVCEWIEIVFMLLRVPATAFAALNELLTFIIAYLLKQKVNIVTGKMSILALSSVKATVFFLIRPNAWC